MKKQTVHQLRKKGWKVRVGHKRIIYRFDPKTGKKYTRLCLFKDWQKEYPEFFMSPKGGVTEVSITTLDGVTLSGFADCNDTDYYNSKIGLNIALGRVLADIEKHVS